MGEAQPKPEPFDDVAALIAEARMKGVYYLRQYEVDDPTHNYPTDLPLRQADALERLAKERDEADGWRIRYGEVVAKHAELEAALTKAQAELDLKEKQIASLVAHIKSPRRAKAQAAVPVALEWGPLDFHPDSPDAAQADAIFNHRYHVQRDPWAPTYVAYLHPRLPITDSTLWWQSKGHADLNAAKDAAQADYERRIRDALTAAPPTPSDGLLKALENVDKAITSARNYIPDDDEGVASDIFAYYLNAAQMELRAALAEQEKANARPAG